MLCLKQKQSSIEFVYSSNEECLLLLDDATAMDVVLVSNDVVVVVDIAVVELVLAIFGA
jgi:hypothetical protein